jgi:hypothetical protein
MPLVKGRKHGKSEGKEGKQSTDSNTISRSQDDGRKHEAVPFEEFIFPVVKM